MNSLFKRFNQDSQKNINQKRRHTMNNIHTSLTKGLRALALGAALFVAAAAHQADAGVLSQNLEIHVSINAAKSLSAGTTYYNFGQLTPNVSSVSASALVITNDSGSLVETYT